MTVAMKKQLDESLRDAQLAFYLHKIAPGKSLPGTVRLKTARDLYEYWLLDVLVSQDVPTTPVACAIASLQQYINRILMNMEPGYDQANITPEQMQTWRNEMHQYPVWAAHQKLLYFPASYLDPVLRNNKSDNFQQLENELNQNRIQTDAVQSAVMAYLTRFEEIANLNILNGYIDGADFANSTYYFIAKSRTESTYFWRSLNMGQRPLDGTLPPPLQSPPNWTSRIRTLGRTGKNRCAHFRKRRRTLDSSCLVQQSSVRYLGGMYPPGSVGFQRLFSRRSHAPPCESSATALVLLL